MNDSTRSTSTAARVGEVDAGCSFVAAYGDADDHLRLVSVLASAVAERAPDHIRQELEATFEPSAPWEARLSGFCTAARDLVRVSRQASPITLIDPDALDVGPVSDRERWLDHDFRTERAALLSKILDLAADGGWRLIRPAPSPALTRRLNEVGVAQTSATPPVEGWASLVPPELQPVVRGLLGRGAFDEHAVWETIEAANGDAGPDFVSAAYSALRPRERKVARRLAVVRGPQLLNGSFGPMVLNSEESARSKDLVAFGILQTCADDSMWMPRTVRAELLKLAWLNEGDEVRAECAALASAAPDRVRSTAEVEAVANAHHSAVLSGDTDLAVRTARLYGADLRHIGYRLSREQRWAEAADVYRRIVGEFDASDAYAWEYLAFNRAMAASGLPERDPDVEHAYKRAMELAPMNPLYSGRYWGYRARHGDGVVDAFAREITRFGSLGLDAAVWFAKPVIEALYASGQVIGPLDELRSRWGLIYDRALAVMQRSRRP